MIKRSNRSRETSTSATAATANDALSDASATNEFGRPIELCIAEPDPDSLTAWMAEGNCRLYPPAAFFPSDGVGVDRARKICKDCPVLARCLDYALEERIEHGVWGGCSERERRRILKRRRDDAVRLAVIS
jgi:WhiB family redox-sensing transcriptional regulator